MLDGACRRVSACLADSTRHAAGPFPLSTLRRWVNEQKMPPTVTVTQCLRPSMAAAIPETDAHTQVWRPSDAAHSMRLGEVLGRVGWAPPPPPAPPMYVGPMPPPQRPGGPPPAIPQNPYAVNPSPQNVPPPLARQQTAPAPRPPPLHQLPIAAPIAPPIAAAPAAVAYYQPQGTGVYAPPVLPPPPVYPQHMARGAGAELLPVSVRAPRTARIASFLRSLCRRCIGRARTL